MRSGTPTLFGDLKAMKRAFTRAAELAERAGNTEFRLKALWGTWAAGRGGGDHQVRARGGDAI